ncbi:MAG: hypothetical protein Q9174_003496 [Haloplaca sp. 1 TL-2023]
MEKIIDHYFPCFGSWTQHAPQGIPMEPQQHPAPQQPSNKGAAVPYQNNLAGEMTYTGTSHAKDLRKQSRPHELSYDLTMAVTDRARTVMAWDDGCQDLDLSHETVDGNGRGAANGDHGMTGKHIRFQPNAPTRASTERAMSADRMSPPPISAFEIADDGDVSPISLDGTSSLKEPGTANSRVDIKTLRDERGLIGPVPRQLTRLPSTKATRPTLSLTIPPSTAPLPVEKSTLSDSTSDEGEEEEESGDSGSGDTTPSYSPAHARRLPSQLSTSTPKKVASLSDELADFGVGSASSAGFSARDFAYP